MNKKNTKFGLKINIYVFGLFFSLLVISLIIPTFLDLPKAHAENPNSVYPGSFYGEINRYDSVCPGDPRKYASYTWLSEAGNSTLTQTESEIPYGTRSVAIQFNYHMFACRDLATRDFLRCYAPYWALPPDFCVGGALTSSWNKIVGASVVSRNADIGSSPVGQTAGIGRTSGRYWGSGPIGFSINSPTAAGFTSSILVTVQINSKSINYFGGNGGCIANGARVPGIDWCPTEGAQYSFFVRVQPPPPTINPCSVGTNPTTPEPGEPFSVNASFSITGRWGRSYPYSYNWSPISGGLPLTGAISGNGSVVEGGTVNVTRGSPGFGRGVYNGSFTANLGSPLTPNTTTCNFTIQITAKPYFRVYQGDISAGDTFAGQPCPSDTFGTIKAFNKGNAGYPVYGGAGGQIAALAREAIDQFTSSSLIRAPSGIPSYLSFANNRGGYGGRLGSCAQTIADYWAGNTGSAPPSDNIATIPSGTYKSANTFLTGSVAVGKRVTIYVDGNATVTGAGITYAGGSWDISNIPSFTLIAKGNIYISSSVTQLDGTYIALPRDASNGGIIYTCTNGASPYTAAQGNLIASNCANKLTINGAFIAKQVKLLRVRGTLRDSSALVAPPPPTPSAPPQIGFHWQSWNGTPAGMHCIYINEPSDPNTWNDNWLCTPRNIGLRWSYAGAIAGMSCVSWNEPAEPWWHTWGDNYLCSPTNLGLVWYTAGPVPGMYCTQIFEFADPHTWSDNYLCEPRSVAPPAPPASVPAGEASTSDNIAEVFNYTPDAWLGLSSPSSSTSTEYDSITNLPPIL